MRVLAGAALSVLAFSCSLNQAPSSSPTVYGGHPVSLNGPTAKSVVALRLVDNVFCSATLITEDLALTAGHCIAEFSTTALRHPRDGERFQAILQHSMRNSYVSFGIDAHDVDAPVRRITAWTVTPQWKRIIGIMENLAKKQNASKPFTEQDQNSYRIVQTEGWQDLALVRFKGGIPKGYQPALVSKSPLEGGTVYIAGYGISEVGERDLGMLRGTRSYVYEQQHDLKQFVVTGTEGRGTCKGDSGGPAFDIVNDRVVIRGVVSRGTNGSCQDGNSVYTDVGFQMEWLEEAKTELHSAVEFPEPTVELTVTKIVATSDTYLKVTDSPASELHDGFKCFVKKGELVALKQVPTVLGRHDHERVELAKGFPSCSPNFSRHSTVTIFGAHFAQR